MLDEAKDEFDATLDYVQTTMVSVPKGKCMTTFFNVFYNWTPCLNWVLWTQTSNIKAILSASCTRSILASFTPSATPRL